ncbi:MAG: phosphoglycolate phosphatase [Gammaproteobacteria bacterium]|nr:phosphoglycolate phosphatase [Gammaproteobacteria bacterium]
MTTRLPVLRTVLFDLDGTLLDTAPDLAHALNQVLIHQGRAPLPFERIRPVVSHGGKALIELGFGIDELDAGFTDLRRQLLDIYRANLARETRLFPGMEQVLEGLSARGLNWGVVTNKPGWLTEPLLRELGLYEQAACVVSGDSVPERKPHPAPMLHACRLAGCEAPQCLYVGDAQRDIDAGRNAGMHTLVALFGYIQAEDRPEEWRADAMVEQPLEILDQVDRLRQLV